MSAHCDRCDREAMCHVRIDGRDTPLCDGCGRRAVLGELPRRYGWGGAGWRDDGTRHSDDAIRAHYGPDAIGGSTSSPIALMRPWQHDMMRLVAVGVVCPSGGCAARTVFMRRDQ